MPSGTRIGVKNRERTLVIGVVVGFLLLLAVGLSWKFIVQSRASQAGTGQNELIKPAGGVGSVLPHSGVGGLLAESYAVATIPSGWSERAGLSAPVPAEAPPPSANAVRLTSGFEGSVPLDARNLDDTHIVVRFPSAATIWYLFKLENLQGRKVRIDFQNIRADRWLCNRPVYSDATDLSDPVPAVNGEPREWNQVSKVWGVLDSISFEQTFPSDAVYVATRVPYTPSYNERYLSQIPKSEGMSVEQVGQSLSGRPLQAVVFLGSSEAAKTRPCIFAYAREHANESDASWAIQGMIEFLRSDSAEAKDIRDHFTVILIPLIDPDGAAVGAYDRITDLFIHGKAPLEAEEYAHWFEGWIKHGNRLDLVIDLHNPALGPYLNLNFAVLDHRPDYAKFATQLNAQIMSTVQRAGFAVRTDPWVTGQFSQRLCGWLSDAFGPVVLPYETNSEGLGSFIGVGGVRRLGEEVLLGGTAYLASENGAEVLRYVDGCRTKRSSAISKWTAFLDSADDPFTAEARISWYSTGKGDIIPPSARKGGE